MLLNFPFSFLLRLSLQLPEALTEGRPEEYERPTFDTDLLTGDRLLIIFFRFAIK